MLMMFTNTKKEQKKMLVINRGLVIFTFFIFLLAEKTQMSRQPINLILATTCFLLGPHHTVTYIACEMPSCLC